MESRIKTFFNSKWHKQIFIYILNFSYLLIFISLTGLISWAPKYVTIIQKYIIYYISIILVARFNPFTNKNILYDEYDRRIVFSAGVALLLTTSAVHVVENYILNDIREII